MASDVVTAPRRPPTQSLGAVGWLRENLFNGWLNSLITIVLLLLLIRGLTAFVTWFLTTPGWVAVLSNLRLFMVYIYPAQQIWRIEVGIWIVALLLGVSAGVWKGIIRQLAIGFVALLTVSIILPLLAPPSGVAYQIPPLLFLAGGIVLTLLGYPLGLRFGPALRWPLLALWALSFPFIMLVLVYGAGPLPDVPTNVWGGLLVTMALTVVGIVGSFPLGVLLALGRRSTLPVVRGFCTLYIELIRGVPLVTVFFMGQFLLPLFLPQELRIDNLLRAMIAVTLFSAAYLAENVRGGLQSIPRGQMEAAHALGLNYVQTTLLITLPQALRAVIPALVGQFISLFKDTSLVAIIGLFDFLGVARVVQAQPQWLGTPGGVWRESLFFVALVYFIFSFTMSRVSLHIERNVGVGQR